MKILAPTKPLKVRVLRCCVIRRADGTTDVSSPGDLVEIPDDFAAKVLIGAAKVELAASRSH